MHLFFYQDGAALNPAKPIEFQLKTSLVVEKIYPYLVDIYDVQSTTCISVDSVSKKTQLNPNNKALSPNFLQLGRNKDGKYKLDTPHPQIQNTVIPSTNHFDVPSSTSKL